MSTSNRACLRCISKKRKCDHAIPSCGLCMKAGHVCEYPTERQKRGPTAGSSKACEVRVQQLENALYLLMSTSSVRAALEKKLENIQVDNPLPPAPSASIDRPRLLELWNEKPLKTYKDLLGFTMYTAPIVSLEEPVRSPQASASSVATMDETSINNSPTRHGEQFITHQADLSLSCDTRNAPSPLSNLDFLASSAISLLPTLSSSQADDARDYNFNLATTQRTQSFEYLPSNGQAISNSFASPGDTHSPLPYAISPIATGHVSRQLNIEDPIQSDDLFW
ncbi:hypothetical protein V866_006958 [Kwoniella sp. B9012]